MKSWVLGEELSTMRFTTLIRASLSLICSRGRNGRLRCSPRGVFPTPPGLQEQWRVDPPGASSTLSALARHSPAVDSGLGPALKLPTRNGHDREAGGCHGLARAQGHLPGCLSIAGLAPRPSPRFSFWFGHRPHRQWERLSSPNGN